MNAKAIEKTELNKILSLVADYAVLDETKKSLSSFSPFTTVSEVERSLKKTDESRTLLFETGVGKIEYFPPFFDEFDRAKKGSTLALGELMKVGVFLRSARIAYTSVKNLAGKDIKEITALADRLYFDKNLEDDIAEKIVSDTELSDHASEKLYNLRKEIRSLNERIRARLTEYLSGDDGKYLQDGIITMRNNRYVLPVRAEYKRNIKGFIHDKSASGATFFIEPEEILEMNNELKDLEIDEREEVERILKDISLRVGMLSDRLKTDKEILEELDAYYARAEFAYKNACVCPTVNQKGIVSIREGRHPLIDRKKVVPVSVSLGKDYRFLLISGPNTGGKTVSLKMVGLFCLMACCGLFIPAKEAEISVFDEIYCDIGDSQSIEENLSTFSSHVTNVIHIVDHADEKSLVLIDELGGGTNPEEGQALAKAVVSYLLSKGCFGVVTTHYSALKEFAFATKGIENACMEFDVDTLRPLYVMKIGLPGSSNALAVARRLGLKESILTDALSSLSQDEQKFEHIVRSAEESRVKADEILSENMRLNAEWLEKIKQADEERERLKKEKEKLFANAKAEARRIVNERTFEAEELLEEMKKIFSSNEITEADLIRARTLKNKLSDKAFDADEEETPAFLPVDVEKLKTGDKVFIKNVNQFGIVQSVRKEKKEAEILCGSIRIRSKISDLSVVNDKNNAQTEKKAKDKVSVTRNLNKREVPNFEINLIGFTVDEALPEVESFLDGAILSNLEEVRIVHGFGSGKLRKGIHAYLKGHKRVDSFRLGQYGEGEAGVTIVKLK